MEKIFVKKVLVFRLLMLSLFVLVPTQIFAMDAELSAEKNWPLSAGGGGLPAHSIVKLSRMVISDAWINLHCRIYYNRGPYKPGYSQDTTIWRSSLDQKVKEETWVEDNKFDTSKGLTPTGNGYCSRWISKKLL